MECYGVDKAHGTERVASSIELLNSDRELCIAGGDGDCGIEGCTDTSPHLHVHARAAACETEGCDSQPGAIVYLARLGSGLCALASDTAEDHAAGDDCCADGGASGCAAKGIGAAEDDCCAGGDGCANKGKTIGASLRLLS